jgi:hypothetical protein
VLASAGALAEVCDDAPGALGAPESPFAADAPMPLCAKAYCWLARNAAKIIAKGTNCRHKRIANLS